MTTPAGIRISAPARLDQVRLLVLGAMAVCREARPDGTALDDLELALAETLNNVVEHGNPTGTPKTMEVAIELGADAVVLTVFDDGLPRPDFPAAILPAEGSEGGYGLFLIQQMVDEVAFGRDGDRNFARLVKRREGVA